jgi:hypothetical protein
MPTHTLKKTTPALPADDAELLDLLSRARAAQLEKESLVAKRELAKATAAEPFEPEIERLTEKLKADVELLKRWSVANKDRFGKARSLTLGGHRWGWELGNWATELKGKLKWEHVLQNLRDIIAAATRSNASDETRARAAIATGFIRTVEEPAKDNMINSRDDAAAVKVLEDVGVKVTRKDTFFLQADRDEQAPARLKAE